ncbi:hypothetical protein A7K94_0221335, partial [Modestobacter sp. VKM Ac-2676]
AAESSRRAAGKKAGGAGQAGGQAVEEGGQRRGELEKAAGKRRGELEKAAGKARKDAGKRTARTVTSVKRRVGVEPEPRRWPWVLAVLAVVAGVVVVLRGKKREDPWNPAPTGDGPVPSYREDPVSTSSTTPAGGTESAESQGKTVSSAETAPSDSAPTDTNIGALEAQPASGAGEPSNQSAPEPATSTSNDPDLPVATSGPASSDAEDTGGPEGTPGNTRG